MSQVDVLVLGAGMVGVSAALHLQARGRQVVLVDRRDPGEETSFGNAGILEREGLEPVAPPRDLKLLLQLALNLRPEAHYHPGFLPRIAPWIWKLARAASPEGIRRYAAGLDPIAGRAAGEHLALMREADAERFLRKTGWIRLFRTKEALAAQAGFHALVKSYGIAFDQLDRDGLAALEPHLDAQAFVGATRWPTTWTVSSPGGLTKAYAGLFAARDGRFVHGDAKSLRRGEGMWTVTTREGEISARDVVVCLGPWAMDVLSPLGLKLPFAVKRGYHRHFRPQGNAVLNHPVVDGQNGFVLSQMEAGIRITTGVEFADRDAPSTPVQLDKVVPLARAIFPLGEAVEAEPWRGARPCLPDSLPIVGPAPGLAGLWLDFGHGHLGLTLGPVTGRLIAELITGAAPVVDPRPYRADRF